MQRLWVASVVAALLAWGVEPSGRQGHFDSPEAIESGGRIFQSGCARCHGASGDQVPGVTLGTGRFRRAMSDQELARLIIEGIPLTGMPASNLSEQEAANVVAYLRSLADGGRAEAAALASLPGDLDRGRTLVAAKGQCLTCHSIAERGARTGPDLGSVGVRPPDELRRSILDPEAEIRPENRSVRVVTRQGTTVAGRLLNHDFFTVQLLDSMERLRSFTKSELREFTILKTSPMPSYRDRLSADEVTDIVKYLSSLRGRQ